MQGTIPHPLPALAMPKWTPLNSGTASHPGARVPPTEPMNQVHRIRDQVMHVHKLHHGISHFAPQQIHSLQALTMSQSTPFDSCTASRPCAHLVHKELVHKEQVDPSHNRVTRVPRIHALSTKRQEQRKGAL